MKTVDFLGKVVRGIGGYLGITACFCIFIVSAGCSWAQVAITASAPAYNFAVLAGSTRQIYVNITGGTQNTVYWSVLSTTGGAYASFTTPSASNVSAVSGGLPAVQVNIGSTAGNCTVSGSLGNYSVTSTATVTVQAQSMDDVTKTATFLFNVCSVPLSSGLLANGTNPVIVAPAYQQAYQGQPMTLQSWVIGYTDETGTWSIGSQPTGGNGTLVDTGNRDTVFSATVTGRYTINYTSHANGALVGSAIIYVSPNPLPSYVSTQSETRPHECYPDPALAGADFEVGTGYTYASPIAVPASNTWTPGTIMRIHNTGGSNPTVYYNYIQIGVKGTATQPIVVCGVDDSGTGNLPILDGNNATGQSVTSTGAAAGFGVVSTWGGYGSTPYGYWQAGSAGPNYVSITGLHIRNGNPLYNYTPPGGGSPVGWNGGASCVNLRSGAYVDVSGNEMDSCANGFFTAENASSGWVNITQDVTVTGNHITNSGVAGNGGDHQVYFETFYGLFEGNRVDNYLCTASGSNVKWRGVEGIFRYNYLQGQGSCSGPLRDFDLVDNENATPYVSLESYLYPGPSGGTGCDYSMYCLGDTAGPNIIAAYQEGMMKDFAYGNILGTVSGGQVHYNGDSASGLGERQGILYFYSNTLQGAGDVFDTENNSDNASILNQLIDARNNIFWATEAPTSGYYSVLAMNRSDTELLASTTNLYQTGSIAITPPITGGVYTGPGGQVGWGQGGCYGSGCPWPLTNPLNTHLYGLSNANFLLTPTQPFDSTTFIPPSGSAAIGAGTALSGVLATMPIRWNFNEATSSLTPRIYPLTIGAEDQPGATTASAATPAFSLAGGTYTSAQTVTISTTTPSATIYYTTSGATPTTGSTVYSGPITVAATETVEAIAVAAGGSPSTVSSAVYTITPATAAPSFSPAPGTYTSAQTVTISTTTPSATIYYTTSGATPTTGSTVYSGPITVAAPETVEAIAVAAGGSPSTVSSAAYTITPATAAPSFSPAAGTYTSAQTVTISTTTPSATIYYTTNGSTPTTSSAVYSGPITVAATETVKAIAIASGDSASTAGSAAYTITPATAAPSFSPAAGTYTSAQTVTISTTTPSATIYYTTNGSTPTTSSAVYSGSITVAARRR